MSTGLPNDHMQLRKTQSNERTRKLCRLTQGYTKANLKQDVF